MKETELKIRTLGDKVLKNGVQQVEKVTDNHRRLLSEMARLMYAVSGIGLAAPQVGITESLIVVDAGSGLYKLVNPRIVETRGQQVSEEGCLSVPEVGVRVKRAQSVVVEGLDENGKPVTIEAEGLLACVFQHEIDHLNGTLIVDHASLIDRIKYGKKIKEI
ncbi:MAG: peptide deformylase [Candidatus Omnitrophota bacterium]